jgi:ankyrin repeat protein
MLEELPETLDETYERILRDINKANRDLAHRLLQCLTVAVRPLSVAELADVLAVDFGSGSRGGSPRLNMGWRWEDQEEAVLSTCSSLVSVVGEDGAQVVQFSHFSVKEFLTSSRIGVSSADVSRFYILLEPAHTILAKACLGVLLRVEELVDEVKVKVEFPLARYAAEHWVDHARFENVSSHIREGMEDLFDPDKPHFAAWLHAYDVDFHPQDESTLNWFACYTNSRDSNTATPLYYAALCGFHDLAEQLIINHPQQVHTTGGYYVSPLGAALSGEHLKIAQLLYDRGAEVDVQAGENRTPLRVASASGHLEIVQWLLSRGANLSARDGGLGFTPLHAAADFGQVEVSRLLLQYKADTYARDLIGRTPLHIAVQGEGAGGQVNVTRLLLEHGADVNASDNKRKTPLHYALEWGHLDVSRLLVEYGANVVAEDDDGRTAFQVASERGYHDFVTFLSGRGSK